MYAISGRVYVHHYSLAEIDGDADCSCPLLRTVQGVLNGTEVTDDIVDAETNDVVGHVPPPVFQCFKSVVDEDVEIVSLSQCSLWPRKQQVWAERLR